MADVSVAPATPPPAPPSVIGVEKSEKKKKKSSKDGRSKTAEERKKKKSASGDEPRRKKKSKKISSTPESDGSPNQEADLGTADGPHALTQEPDTSDGDLKFHDLDEAEDSESEPDHELDLSVPSTRRQSVQSHHRNASNGSRRSYQAPNDPQIEESVRKLSSGASLNVTTLRRSPSGRVRHSVRTSVGSRRSMGLVLEGEQAEHLASVPDLPPHEGGQEEQEPHTHSDPAYKSSPRPQNRARIIDLDAGRPASWRDTPAAQSAPKSDDEGEEEDEENEVPPIGPGPGADPTGSKKSLWSTGAVRLAGVSAAVGGGASSLTSNLGRSLAAGIAAVRGPTPDGREERERVRLPRREVNEDQLAEDIMRFAEARHILRTENNAEKLRELGLRLEQAWREKLAEVQSLRAQLEETQDVLGDLEDENEHLRDQLGLLSEQIATREEAFEEFQSLTASQYQKERQLWSDEVREEKENALTSVARLRRSLAQERATSAQLRLVIHAVKSGRLDVLDRVDLEADVPAADVEQDEKSEAKGEDEGEGEGEGGGEEVFADPSFSADKGKSEAEESENVDDDVLYNLPGSSDKVNTSPGAALMAKNKPMHLRAMQDAGLVDNDSLMGADAGDERPGAAGDNQRTVAIASRVLFDKAAADAALTAALQEENMALRSYQRAKERKFRDLELELAQYRARLAEAQAAVDDALNA